MDAIEEEDRMMAALQAQVDECEAALAGDAAAAGGLRGKLIDLEEQVRSEENTCADFEYDIRIVNRKIDEMEEFISSERRQRRELQDEIRVLETEQLEIFAERDKIAADLSAIAGDVGHVYNDAAEGGWANNF